MELKYEPHAQSVGSGPRGSWEPTTQGDIPLFISSLDEHVCTSQTPCQNGGQCVYDGGGEYHCVCLPGFHGRGCERKAGPCEQAG